MQFDIQAVRKLFPGLASDWILMDNAGGSQIAQPVLDRLNDYLIHTNAQLGGSYQTSARSTGRVAEAHRIMAEFIGASDPGEVVLGSSTSALVRMLAGNLEKYFPKGSEIIVTNCDHEANIGAWRELANKGFVVKTWEINPENWELELDQLEQLMTDKTRLVAFTHTSNILGKINPVQEITQFVHDRGALVCVDAVAYAPHRQIRVKDWDVDFYVFSLYKTYGPHYALMYGKKDLLLALPGNNHYFIGQQETPYKFQPGHVNYELTWAATGIPAYFDLIGRDYAGIAAHEQELSHAVITYLKSKPDIRIIGPETTNSAVRVPTIAFVAGKRDSALICQEMDTHRIGIRFGDFYAARLIDSLGLRPQNGVVRISMVHYNTLEEAERLIQALDTIL